MQENTAMEYYEICVIGAGVVGSSAALNLAKMGKNVLLLEQFPLPHSRGCSHGQSRIMRYSYPNWKYAQLMPEALSLWKDIELQSKTQLLEMVGYLAIEDLEDDIFDDNLDQLKKLGVEPQILDSETLQNRFPMLSYGTESRCFLETKAGVLNPNKCCRSIQKLVEEYGGVIKDCEQVTRILPGNKIQLECSKGKYVVDKLVIATGAYSSALLKQIGVHIPLQPVGVQVRYWPTNEEGYKAMNGFPVVSHRLGGNLHAYSLPCLEYPNMIKICLHQGVNVDPSQRSLDMAKSRDETPFLASYIRQHYKGVGTTPVIAEECMYCVTPDQDFVVDSHPRHPNIVIGAGFSGHGFKMAPVIGKILAHLAYGQQPEYDISPFSINRFHQAKASL